MSRLSYTQAELVSEHAYARPHEIEFFDADARLLTGPRMPRVELKQQILLERDGARILDEFDRLSDLGDAAVSAG